MITWLKLSLRGAGKYYAEGQKSTLHLGLVEGDIRLPHLRDRDSCLIKNTVPQALRSFNDINFPTKTSASQFGSSTPT
jgi:hypothetical protein